MSRRALHRLITTLCVVLSLLFSQLALARYVCPGVPDMAAMAMAADAPCAGMDAEQPVLCQQYAVNAPQSVEQAKLATPSLPAIIQVLLVPAVLDAPSNTVRADPSTAAARPPPEPVFLSTRRLRV